MQDKTSMASAMVTKKMREDATCSICEKLMTEPTSIDCGHSFCNSCIVDILEQRVLFFRRTRPCPLCQTPFTRRSLRPNKQLQNLIEALQNIDDKNLCEEHGEQLHLFCEDDDQVICWCCERSPQHRGHATLLITDACKVYKEKLQKAMATLRNLEEECQSQMKFTAMHRTECERKIENQKQKIQSDFRNLQRFLLEEEKCYLRRLETEKEKVLKRLRDNEANLQEQMQQLKKHIEELEEKCRGSAKELLQDVKGALNRSSAINLVKPKEVLMELDVACNVSKLYFDVTKILRRYQASVVLDPDTAHPKLIVSKDQRQVTHGCVQKKPHSPGRFAVLPCVLGSERFTSGKHYFEVDVGEGTQWDVGVCLETVARNVDTMQGPQSGFWAMRLCKDKGYVALNSPLTPLHLKEHLEVVGLFLDYETGFVSFYNVNTGSHIYTFPRASFSQALRPYLQVYPYSPLFLPPPDE